MLSGLSHDPLLRDIFTPLWLGATLCIPAPDYLGSAEQLVDWIEQKEISIAHLTPAMGRLLTGVSSKNQSTTREEMRLESIRYVFFGGDVLTRSDTSRIQALAPSATCVNFYGTTETPQAMGYFMVPNQEDDGSDQDLTREIPLKETLP